MWLTSWLPRRGTKSRIAREGRRSAMQRRPSQPGYKPRVETLEDRLQLSTLTVLNNADSGPGSLRDTITAAAGGDTINFASSLKGQTIALTSGQLSVAKNLAIVGLGAGKLTISGNAASRVFAIAAGNTLDLSRVTVASGFADQGGGIDNAGSLILHDAVMAGNQAVGDSGFTGVGGGIFNEPGASLSISEMSFHDNQVVGGEGPCNNERLGARVKAWQEGAWVRDAAMAHAAKHALKEAA